MDEQTLVQAHPAASVGEQPEGRFLLVLTRQGRVVGTTVADDRPVSVGRSSKCALRCQDPTFPRHAGEVIIRPTPLFRHAGNDADGNRVTPFRANWTVGVKGYRLALLREGESLRAGGRAWAGNGHRRPGQAALAAGAALAVSMALLATAGPGNEQDRAPGIISATVPFPAIPQAVVAVQAPLKGTSPAGKAVSSARPPMFAVTSAVGAANLPRHAGKVSDDTRHGEKTPPRIDDLVVEELLEQAARRLEMDDPHGAGRVLSPVLELLDRSQMDRIIASLEPHASRIFRRAYIRMPYDRKPAEMILRNLAETTLPVLPSCKRAREVLEKRWERP